MKTALVLGSKLHPGLPSRSLHVAGGGGGLKHLETIELSCFSAALVNFTLSISASLLKRALGYIASLLAMAALLLLPSPSTPFCPSY